MQTLPSLSVLKVELVSGLDTSTRFAAHEVFGGLVAKLLAAIETHGILTTTDAVYPYIFGVAMSIEASDRFPHLHTLGMFVGAAPARQGLIQHPRGLLPFVLIFGFLDFFPGRSGVGGGGFA